MSNDLIDDIIIELRSSMDKYPTDPWGDGWNAAIRRAIAIVNNHRDETDEKDKKG